MKIFSALIFAILTVAAGRKSSRISRIRSLPEVHGHKFYFFGYDMSIWVPLYNLETRNPQILGFGLLKDYRVDFAVHDDDWKGALATLVADPESQTWGPIWDLDLSLLTRRKIDNVLRKKHLRQTSVQVALLSNATEVPVQIVIMTEQPQGNVHDMPPNEIPEDRKPSKTFLKVMVKGAIRYKAPVDYVNWLKEFKHNNQTVPYFESAFDLESIEL